MSNFGFWKVGTRNGLSGAESTQIVLDDGRVQTIKDKDNPFEIVRIVRAFDPCIACAVH